MMKKLVLGAIVSLIMSGLAYAGDLKISGGAAPMNNILKRIKEPVKSKGLNLILEETGPEIALSRLDKGEIDAAVAGLNPADFFSLAKEKNITITTPQTQFVAKTIGMDRVRIAVNPKTNAKKLSEEQLKGIFSGKIKNWKEAGGADLPVYVVWGDKIGGTNKTFEKNIMGGEKVVPNETTGTVVDVAGKVASKEGAIGLCVYGGDFKGVDFPEIPTIRRPITLLSKGEPKPDLAKLLEFIAGEGKKMLGE